MRHHVTYFEYRVLIFFEDWVGYFVIGAGSGYVLDEGMGCLSIVSGLWYSGCRVPGCFFFKLDNYHVLVPETMDDLRCL